MAPLGLSAVFLAEVLLGVSLSTSSFCFFPPPGVLGTIPDSGFGFSYVVAFLFTEERVVVLDTSLEGEGDLGIPSLGCPGASSAGLPLAGFSGLES